MALKIKGDLEVLIAWQQLWQRYEPNFMTELSRFLPAPVAYALTKKFKSLTQWQQQNWHETKQNAKEFIMHEQTHLLTQPEFNIFRSELLDLQRDVERLSARLARVFADR